MLKTIQIIALLQGTFLLFILFLGKNESKKINFWLLFTAIISSILFAMGDDNYNLFVENSNWFLFHEPLIITAFFILVRYYKSNKSTFNKKDLLFIVPFLLDMIFHSSETFFIVDNNPILIVIEVFITFIFIGMLFYAIYDVIKNNKEKWLLFFLTPLTFIFTISELNYLLTRSKESTYYLDSYGFTLITVFLFYFVLYKLIVAPKDLLPEYGSKYKSSNLNEPSIVHLKTALHYLIVEEKWYKNQKLTVNEVAKELGVPRQQVSEVLNVHMQTGFQDFLNKHRVEEFISCLQNDSYNSYTLLAIANEAGFNSKSSFNTIFKKLKGMTPSQYKKELNF